MQTADWEFNLPKRHPSLFCNVWSIMQECLLSTDGRSSLNFPSLLNLDNPPWPRKERSWVSSVAGLGVETLRNGGRIWRTNTLQQMSRKELLEGEFLRIRGWELSAISDTSRLFGLCSHLFLKQSLKWIKCLSLRFVVVLGWLHGAGLLNGWRDCNEQTVAGCTLLHLLACVFECKTQYLHVYITTYDFWIHKCPRFSTHPWWNYLSCSA